jgi:hypothetical protein
MLGFSPISSAPISSSGESYTYTLSADLGTYAQTGSVVGLSWSGGTTYYLSADLGTYSQTGSTATLTHTYNLVTDLGEYNQTGNDAITTYGRIIAGTGTYAQTGSTVNLVYHRKMVVEAGEYEQTGYAIPFFNNAAEQWTLNFLIDLLPATDALTQEYRPRLTVDGTELKIISWTYREEKQALAGRLDVQLANVDQRSLITKDAEITFDLGTVAADASVTYETLVDTGKLERTDYNLSREGIGRRDTFTLTAKPAMLVKFEKTALNGYVLYDPRKHEIDEASWPVIRDTNGNGYAANFIQVYGLTLHQILTFAAETICGFDAMETNIPNFHVGMVEFRPGELVMNSIGGLIGMFEPDFSEITEGILSTLYIRDGTAGLPPGIPSPRSIGVSEARQLGVSADHGKVDAILLTYLADVREYDTSTDRTEEQTQESGTGDEFTRTITTDTYVDYFRNSNPGIPVRTLHLSKDIDVYHNIKTYDVILHAYVLTLALTETSSEGFHYDAMGRLSGRRKTASKRLPDADNNFTMGLIPALDESESIEYLTHPFRPMRTYVNRRVINTSGLIFVDGDNPQLDEPYGQDANKVYRSGNATNTQIAVWGALSTYIEKGEPLRNGKVRYHIIEIDQAAGVVADNREEERDGELGTSSKIQEPRQAYVLQDDERVRTTDKIIGLHSGEAPIGIAIPLARRVLIKANQFPNELAMELIGIDNSLQKGTPIKAIGRDGEDLGDYIIEARTMNGSRAGHFMSIEVRQAN